ncbi:adenosylcobinamide-GDP ribazoletransferase [Clostridium weizhouense]|uniref:Adenosylcobinamide-GDP ribazoletransferase n=1 Tax=Clostridium weizhouense TaxID=2859781 RepID=A0ABS7AMB0_9CLOT|nr:adenosylcobinamide-GDP ribazoletransferase [Clostridium weizhouense]MBW6409213.1 adenosylcobinamide-GDP ribazoletransferase [Clostridium weizhouense]
MKKLIKGLIMCLSMFTIIPMPYVEWDDDGAKNMMKFYPLIGGIVGAVWVGIFYILNFFNISLILKSVLLMVVPFIVTGMLHLDGFMDVCDAILSRRERKEKLRILKDSATGAFAVIALIILFFVQFGSMYSFLEKRNNPYILILIPIVSRCIAGYFLISKITIKESLLGSYFKKGTGIKDKTILLTALVLTYFISCMFLKSIGIIIVPTICLIITFCVNKCIKELGGISGDVAGFSLVMGEIAGLLVAGIF